MRTWKEDIKQTIQFYPKVYNTGFIVRSNNMAVLMVNFDRYHTTFSDLVSLLEFITKGKRGECLSKIHIYVDLCPNENLVQYFDDTGLSSLVKFINTLYLSITYCMIDNKYNTDVIVHFNKKQINMIGSETNKSLCVSIKNEIKSYENVFLNYKGTTTFIEKRNVVYKYRKGQYVVIGLPISSNQENRFSFQNLYSETCVLDFDYLKPFFRLNNKNGKIFSYKPIRF